VRTIASYLTDKTFLEKVVSYLEIHHGVRAVIVDKDGHVDPLDGYETWEYTEKKDYPVPFQEDIGGFRCSAQTAAELEKANPHIRICMDGLLRMIEKAEIIKETMDEMLRLSDQLHFLLNLANKLAGIQDLQRYRALVIQEISEAIFADAAFVHAKGRENKPHAILLGLSDEEVEAYDRDPVFQSLPEGKTSIISMQDGTPALATPIKEKEDQIGHMVFLKRPERSAFSAYDRQFVSIINDIISPTMEALELNHSLNVLYLNTVKALAAAIDAKDPYTHGHSFRVARYSVAIGKQFAASLPNLPDLEIAAYMHDLGKIGVSETILGKRGRLSATEFEEIKKHPVLTNKILEPIHLPEFIINATLQHHERLDGRGYPLGLKGDSISLFARIIAVADVFDALTSARPYRDALPVEDALTTLCQGIDCEYDRNVVHAFISALRNNAADTDLASVYSGLKFMRIDQMNHFLEKLTQYLIGSPICPPNIAAKPSSIQEDIT
jgi:HD-GYP domain-containing protein (c-di-GMP phosphodiesterase class II)